MPATNGHPQFLLKRDGEKILALICGHGRMDGRWSDASQWRVYAIGLGAARQMRPKPFPKTAGLSSNRFGQRAAELRYSND